MNLRIPMLNSFAVNHCSSSWLIKASFFIASLALITPAARAGVDSVEEHYYPSVIRLEQTASGLRALLGRRFMTIGDEGFPIARPILRYVPAKGWVHDEPYACGKDRDFTCLPKKREEEAAIPPITLSREEAIALRPRLQQEEQIEQKVYAWTQYGGFIWFGIAFYDGEGVSGVGGIGRYNPKTKKMEIRRPQLLRDVSIGHIAHDGETLWLGTAGYYEGPSGYGHGLVRYDWKTDRISSFEGTDDGPCGFMVHGLHLEKNSLWVATDLGLSRWDRKSRRWDHYVPYPAGSPPMRTVTCPDQYASLLKTLPRSFQPSFDTIPYSELFQSIKRFRPRFLKSYVQEMPLAEWGCDELKFLAEGAQDFQALKAKVLGPHPVGSHHFRCVLEGFGAKNSRDPEWRDVLLRVLQGLGEEQHYDDERVLYPLLKGFPGDVEIGEALARRLRTARNPWYEAELLPIFLGEKSVWVLIEAFDRFQDLNRRDHILRAIIKGLMQATGLWISPNGTVLPAPSNTDDDTYWDSDKALPHVVSHWKKWWEIHKTEYGVGPDVPGSRKLDKETLPGATPIEPRVTLSAPSSPLPLGTVYTLTVSVRNLAEPATPPLSNLPLSLQVMEGPHKGVVTPFRGVTDASGRLAFSYGGTKSGTDKIRILYEGDEIFMDEEYAEVTWGGPDLVIPFFIPPLIQYDPSISPKTIPVRDWTQNRGTFPAPPSTTRYFLSPHNPPDPGKARVIGERKVPTLQPGEFSQIKELRFELPPLSPGMYYLAACADAGGKVLESDEQNNCSYSQLPGQMTIIVPFMPMDKSSE